MAGEGGVPETNVKTESMERITEFRQPGFVTPTVIYQEIVNGELSLTD